jgi:hypothetical protein
VTEINWSEIERLMFKAFTGGKLSESEQDLVQRAHTDNPEEYAARHSKIRSTEIERRRRFLL